MHAINTVANAVFVVILAVLAVLEALDILAGLGGSGHITIFTLYGIGVLFGLLSFRRSYPVLVLRALAAASVVMMLVCFVLFLVSTATVAAGDINNTTSHLWIAVTVFAMMPIVAHFTCRMKAGGCDAYFKACGRSLPKSPSDHSSLESDSGIAADTGR